MTTFTIVLPNYDRYTVIFNRKSFLFLFPDSVISSVLTNTDSTEIEIQELSITPEVLNLLSNIVKDQPLIPIPEEKLIVPSRYLGIPALGHPTVWFAIITSQNFLPLFGLYNALLSYSNPTAFLSMLEGKEFYVDEALIRAIVMTAMDQHHPEIVQRFLSYPFIQTYEVLAKAVNSNEPDIVLSLLKTNNIDLNTETVIVPGYQIEIPKVLGIAIMNGFSDILALLLQRLNESKIRNAVLFWIEHPRPELLDVFRPYMTHGIPLDFLGRIEEVKSGKPTLNRFYYFGPGRTRMVKFLASFATNDDVKRQIEQLTGVSVT